MVALITIPYMISFIVMDYELIRLDKVNIAIYAICWLDILLNCITGYYDTKISTVQLKPAKILLWDISFAKFNFEEENFI
jgi:hypothetical protein